MALLVFPPSPYNGQIYPNPTAAPAGTSIYRWDASVSTWVLLGTASGAAPGTYGNSTEVGQFTVDYTGAITFSQNVPIQLGDTTQVGLVRLVNSTLSNDSGKALTAAQGYYLQNQIGNIAALVPPAIDLVQAINATYAKTADLVLLNPSINGNTTVQSALEDAVYNIASAGNTVTISSSPTGLFNVEVTQATETQLGGAEVATQLEVNAGTDDTKFVTPRKLATFAATGGVPASLIPVIPSINGNTTVQSVLEDAIYNVASSNSSLIVTEGAVGQVSLDLLPALTTQSGIVQLNNTLTSGATDQALTAAMGQSLQQQLSALAISGGLTNAGTFDASTGTMINVSVAGGIAGFTVGLDVPSPSPTLLDYFVQVVVPGTYSPPGGGGPFTMVQGDWLFCNGTNWIQIEIGPRLPDATTTIKGAVELATDAETQAGTSSAALAITPASLSSRTATETRTGLAEIATQAEVNTGTDNSRIVTPLTLATYVTGGGTTQLYHYVQLDDFSSAFDGSTTSFTLAIGSTAYAPSPSGNLMVFLGGIAQIPGASNAYTVSGSTITFAEAPASGTTFYATTVSSN